MHALQVVPLKRNRWFYLETLMKGDHRCWESLKAGYTSDDRHIIFYHAWDMHCKHIRPALSIYFRWVSWPLNGGAPRLTEAEACFETYFGAWRNRDNLNVAGGSEEPAVILPRFPVLRSTHRTLMCCGL